MAARYWVGGAGTWSSANTTNWSATSGGAGGASVPGSADTPNFDANSGTGVVTFTNGGVTVGQTIINNAGIELSLNAAFTSSGSLTVTSGTLTTNNYNVTATALSSNNSNTRAINLGSSTLTLNFSTALNFTTATNLTFNAGTSTINFSASAFAGGSQTFYNVATNNANSAVVFTGANTFNNLTLLGRTSAGINRHTFNSNQTINGTLTLTAGTDATMRTFLSSNTIGSTRTLTCAAVASLTDVDFRDITIAGAAAPVSGTRLGDCKGNSGITFDAAKTVYWRLGSGNFGAAKWASTSGGSTSTDNFPLAQDTAIFNNANVTTGSTATLNAAYNLGAIDMSGMTSNTMTLATGSNAPAIYGNWINGTGTTLTGTSTLTFAGRGSQTITSAGKTFTQAFSIQSPSGSVTLQDALTSSNLLVSPTFDIRLGTFDLNGYNLTQSANSAVGLSLTANPGDAAMVMGAGNISIGSSGSVAFNNAVGCSVTGSGTISFTHPTGIKEFRGGGVQTYPTINQGGTGTLTISGSNKFANITNTAIGRVQFTGGTTNEFTAFNLNGTSTAARLALGSTNTTQVTLKAPSWNVGTGSLDSGNNTGLSFTAGTVDFLNISYVIGVVTSGTISVFITEAATGSSSESPVGTYNITLAETTTARDTAAAQLLYIGTLSESATISDVAEAIKLFLASVSESATSSDLIAAALTFASTVSELTTASDSAASSAIMGASASELAAAADSIVGGLFFLSDITESATAADTAAALLIFNRTVSEATTAANVLAAIATFQAAVPESVVGSDVARALLQVGASVNETLTALDEVVSARTTSPTVSESATTSEAVTNVYTSRPTISESVQVIDAAQVVASTFGAASAETANALDAPQGANTGTSTLAESATVSESNSAAFNPSTQISESAQQSDSTSAVAAFFSDASELATAQDQASVAPSVFSAVALAAAEAAESFNPAGSIYNVVLPIQGAGITDSLVGAFLWNDIDDTQIPDWGNVNNTQTPAWASVDDTQSVSWQNVTTTQTPAWTDVDDTQTPGWTPITPQG